jgi:hypothetical protein
MQAEPCGRVNQRYANQSMWRMCRLVLVFGMAMPALWNGLLGILLST